MGIRTCVTFLVLLVAATAVEYCDITCGDNIHTMCLYEEGPAPECTAYESKLITESERDDIVRRHNEIRSGLAQGAEPGFPTASNMAEMYWDEELAMIAQRWADQCRSGHDSCRSTEDGFVGQSAASYGSTAPGPVNVVRLVDMFYNEIKNYNYTSGPYQFSSATGHFTQMVWSSTNRVGCGRAYYMKGRFYISYMVCNYAPGGNLRKKPLYQEGPPCDGCECSPRYDGLCA